MATSIIAVVPLGEASLAAWFEDGVCKRYDASEIGVPSTESLRTARVSEDGSAIELDDGTVIDAHTLSIYGREANYVEEEKRRLLKNLSEIRRDAAFSQTKLGEAAGIRQSVISRIEGCEISPQINTLLKLLAPLGKTLEIVDLEEK